jgi:hypothetical protein
VGFIPFFLAGIGLLLWAYPGMITICSCHLLHSLFHACIIISQFNHTFSFASLDFSLQLSQFHHLCSLPKSLHF